MATVESICSNDTAAFFLCVLTVVVIIAVWLIIRQNNKLIESSTRPYIVISYDSAVNRQTKTAAGSFVVKNYGKTSGTITRFQYPESIKKQKNANVYFAVRGATIAPGQTIVLPCEISKWDDETITFQVIYHAPSTEKNYSDTFSFRTAMLHNLQANPENEMIIV